VVTDDDGGLASRMVTIPVGGFVLITDVDRATYETDHTVAPNVRVLGPMTDPLSNGGDTVTLRDPATGKRRLRLRIPGGTVQAFASTRDGGRLAVETSAYPAGQPGWVAVSITDTGVGIPAQNLEQIFEPLFTTRAKGIGLGLALVMILVEGHGGEIKVESDGLPGLVIAMVSSWATAMKYIKAVQLKREKTSY